MMKMWLKKRKRLGHYANGDNRKQIVNRDAVDAPAAAQETETTTKEPSSPYRRMRVAYWWLLAVCVAVLYLAFYAW